MFKKTLAVAVVIGAVQVLGTVTTLAATNTGYDPSSDSTVNLGSSSSTTSQTLLSTISFDTQEAVYQTLGLNVPHDYIWLDVNGNALVGIDPPRPLA